MRLQRVLSRTLKALVLVAAAFLLAPMQAQAHAGHSHSVQPAGRSVQPLVRVRTIEVAPIPVQDAGSVTGTSGVLVSLLPAGHPKTPQGCPAGCCHLAGTGCCALWLAPTMAILAPTPSRPTPAVSATGGSGITPGALPEPPNALV